MTGLINFVYTDLKPFRLVVEFSLERPKGGIKFVVPDMDGTMLDRGAHLFTYGHENSSRFVHKFVESVAIYSLHLCTVCVKNVVISTAFGSHVWTRTRRCVRGSWS